MTDINGKVTAETVLSQCIRMNNDKLSSYYTFNGTIKAHIVSVYDNIKDKNKPLYIEVHYEDIESPSLADILSDLIGILYEYEQKESSKVES
jgi:hypothetical protein